MTPHWTGAYCQRWKQLHGDDMDEGMQEAESPGSHSALVTPRCSSFAMPATPGRSERLISHGTKDRRMESCARSLTCVLTSSCTPQNAEFMLHDALVQLSLMYCHCALGQCL